MPSEILAYFESHGLVGLLAGSLVVFILLFIAELRRKDKSHTTFTRSLLEDERKERKDTHDRFTQSIDKLSDALHELTDSLRRK